MKLSFFEKYLTVFVLLCMAVGVLIGTTFPGLAGFFRQFEWASVNIPIAILIWVMIFPMMLKIDFASIKQVSKKPKGLYLTWVVNWLIKPFTMFFIAMFFFAVVFARWIPSELAKDYLAGAVLLGAAPCTAMVFVWSHLTKGNPAYTLVQVATNDLIILVLFVPIVGFLLQMGGVSVPWDTLALSVLLFVVVPFALATWTRQSIIKTRSLEFLNTKVIPRFGKVTMIGLLVTLILIFSLQADFILSNPFHIILISIPLIIQTLFIFWVTYQAAKKMKLPHDVAAPAGMIGASNFFELAVAVAISLFPLHPGVALVTIVGVLTEVPIMLLLVRYANRTKAKFVSNQKEALGSS